MKVIVSRKAHFNAAHRLYRKDWTDAKNEAIFGKCANPHYHGHNYELIVHLSQPYLIAHRELVELVNQPPI